MNWGQVTWVLLNFEPDMTMLLPLRCVPGPVDCSQVKFGENRIEAHVNARRITLVVRWPKTPDRGSLNLKVKAQGRKKGVA